MNGHFNIVMRVFKLFYGVATWNFGYVRVVVCGSEEFDLLLLGLWNSKLRSTEFEGERVGILATDHEY